MMDWGMTRVAGMHDWSSRKHTGAPDYWQRLAGAHTLHCSAGKLLLFQHSLHQLTTRRLQSSTCA